MKLLVDLESVTDEQVSSLRDEVLPERRELFDKMPEDEKRILALLRHMPDDKLLSLVDLYRKQGHIVGFHDVITHIHTLANLIEDVKYYSLFPQVY